MQSQAKSKLPEVHGVRKNLDPNLRPEKQQYLAQTGKFGKTMYRSGESQIKKERDLIPSIKLSTTHLTCHRKFLEVPK